MKGSHDSVLYPVQGKFTTKPKGERAHAKGKYWLLFVRFFVGLSIQILISVFRKSFKNKSMVGLFSNCYQECEDNVLENPYPEELELDVPIL